MPKKRGGEKTNKGLRASNQSKLQSMALPALERTSGPSSCLHSRPPAPPADLRTSRVVPLQATSITGGGREEPVQNTHPYISPWKSIQQLSSPREPTYSSAPEPAASASALTNNPPPNTALFPQLHQSAATSGNQQHLQPQSPQQSEPWGTHHYQAAPSPGSTPSSQPPLPALLLLTLAPDNPLQLGILTPPVP